MTSYFVKLSNKHLSWHTLQSFAEPCSCWNGIETAFWWWESIGILHRGAECLFAFLCSVEKRLPLFLCSVWKSSKDHCGWWKLEKYMPIARLGITWCGVMTAYVEIAKSFTVLPRILGEMLITDNCLIKYMRIGAHHIDAHGQSNKHTW